jgi:hypothetical protein
MKYAIIDLDAVVAGLWPALESARKYLGRPYLPTPEQEDFGDWPEVEREHVYGVFNDPFFNATMLPVRGALPVLHELSQHYRLVIIPARGMRLVDEAFREMQEVTAKWLAEWQVPYSVIHYAQAQYKGQLAHDYYKDEIAFAVDDSPAALDGYVRKGIFSYVVAYRYNVSISDSELVRRVASLSDVLEHRKEVDTLPIPERTFFNYF